MASVVNYLRIQAAPEKVAAIFYNLADQSAGIGSIDFNKITPMPPWIYQGAVDQDIYGQEGEENCWADWCRENWKIEWNAIEPKESAAIYDGGSTIRFKTRDVDVSYLMEKLSRVYRDVYIDYLWANEDIDKGAGALQFMGGERMVTNIPSAGSRRAYELAFDVLHSSPEEFGLVLDKASNNYVLMGGDVYGSR